MVRETPVATGTVAWHDTKAAGDVNITTVDHDFHDQDIANALTTSIATDGQSVITADIPWNSHKITGLANGTAASDAAAFGQIPAVNDVLIQTQTVGSSVTSVDFTGLSGYNTYLFELSGVIIASNSSYIAVRVQQSGTFQTTTYYGTLISYDSSGGSVINNSVNVGLLPISSGVGAPSTTGFSGTMKLLYPAGAGLGTPTPAQITTFGGNFDPTSSKYCLALGGGARLNTSAAVTGIRFIAQTGNITAGVISLYGIKS